MILISVFERGGAERQALLLARELRNGHGLDVEVWALAFDGQYAEAFEAAGIPIKVISFRWPKSLLQWRGLLRVVRQLRAGRIDVLMPFTAWPNVVAGLTYRLAGIRLCIWGERHAGGERVPGIERLAVKQYQCFVANSTAGVDFLAGEMRVPRERIGFVPNGVEEPGIDAADNWRTKLDLQPDQLLVVMVANITHLKDHATLLHAWKMVQDRWPSEPRPLLALAGREGDRAESCRRIVEEAGIEATVRFLGSITDVPSLLAACDIAAFSSLNEGMPNGVLECMAAGKTVVASDLPGVRDALGSNPEGAVVPPGDASRFAETLTRLLRDKPTRAALGAANLERIRSEFSVEKMAERHLQVIRGGLSRRHGSQRAHASIEAHV